MYIFEVVIFLLLVLILFAMLPNEVAGSELDVDQYVEKYRESDLKRNDGTGYSTYTNSSSLGWGESSILSDYVDLYRVTEDAYWLGKIIQHFDQMIYGMIGNAARTEFREFTAAEVESMVSERIRKAESCDFAKTDDDGHAMWHVEFPGWYTDRYSVAYVKVTEAKSESAKLVPEKERIMNVEIADKITGHEYQIKFSDESHYTIKEVTDSKVIADSVELGDNITGIPGTSIKVEGTPKAGDTFEIETIELKPLQYVVHDGMVLYPVAQFIEIVLTKPDLKKQFGQKAESYVRLIKELIFRKWERYWEEREDNSGAYVFTESLTDRFPGRLMPHNQFNALCRAYLVLQDKNVTDDAELREKAVKMVRYFKRYVKPTGNAWTWNYWDWGNGEDEHSGVEDSSHASINVGTAIEAYHRGIEFDRADMVRFAHTFLDQMWNGSIDDINIGDRVNSNEGNRYFHGRCWFELCEFDPKVWEVSLAWFRSKGESTGYGPFMLRAQQIFLKMQ